VKAAARMLGQVVARRPPRQDTKEDDMGDDPDRAAAGQRFSAPRGAHTKGRLEFPRGAAHLAIHGATMEDLFWARFDQPVPSVAVDGGTITVRYPRFSPRDWLRPGARRGGEVTLNQDLAWRITVRGGVAELDADLRFDEQAFGAVGGGLRLTTPEATQAPDRYEIEIASGAAHLELSPE
jgi:hypothetical protein